MKKILISGISGQVGSYLADIALNYGYEVHGIIRRSSVFSTERIDHIFDRISLHYGDIMDYASISKLVSQIKPDYFAHLACQSHVKVSFDIPSYSFESVAVGTLNCLEAVKNFSPQTKFLHSASSEMYGESPPPQSEKTAFMPCSPYAIGKIAAYNLTDLYRDAYNLFAVNSICFNMESPRRLETFVTRKITRAAARIKLGLQDRLELGNLHSARAWQHAKDGAQAQLLMLQAEIPKNYVVCATEMHTVQEFVEIVFNKLDLNWKDYVTINPKYFRAKEVDALEGDSSLIKNELKWEPEYSFMELVDEMVENDLRLATNEKKLM